MTSENAPPVQGFLTIQVRAIKRLLDAKFPIVYRLIDVCYSLPAENELLELVADEPGCRS